MSEEYERYSLDIAKYILIALQMLGGSASRQEIKEKFVEDKQFDLTYHKVFESYTGKTYSHFNFDFNFGLVALKCCGYIEPYKRNGNIVLTSKGKIFNAKLYPTDEDKKIQQDYWQKAHNKKSNEQAFINWCINHKQLKNQNKLYSKTSAKDFAFMLKKQLCNKIPEIEKEINSSNIFMIIDYELIDAILDKYSNEIYSIDKLANNADGKNSLILYSEFLKGNSFAVQTEQLETIIVGENKDNTKYPLNQILYGPPGTGKTYNTVIRAMEIINGEKYDFVDDKQYEKFKKDFDKLKQQGQIEFVTFHQSYSYEEFVEGIKPDLKNDNDLNYKLEDGIFKKICRAAERELYSSNENREVNFDKIYQMFQEKYEAGSSFSNLLNIKYEPNNLIYHFGVQSQDRRIDLNKIKKIFDSGKQYATALEFNKDYQGNTALKGYFFNFYQELLQIKNDYIDENKIDNYRNQDASKYILIIDEINRGNISKIFGELITLIEEDKRETMSVKLPYSQDTFTVPKNLYIIGTMNTSDRSIASIDIALRRRFKFIEMIPKSELVADFGCDFQTIFEKLNTKIKILLDRDHQIGHSYFINTKYANADVNILKEIWFSEIIPLLNEYFYCDWEKLKLVIPGFIKEINIPEELKNECEDSMYEFKTPNEVKDFVGALKQYKFKQEN